MSQVRADGLDIMMEAQDLMHVKCWSELTNVRGETSPSI